MSDATDLPSPNSYSELHYYNARGDQAQSLPQEMAWMTGLYLDFHCLLLT